MSQKIKIDKVIDEALKKRHDFNVPKLGITDESQLQTDHLNSQQSVQSARSS